MVEGPETTEPTPPPPLPEDLPPMPTEEVKGDIDIVDTLDIRADS